MKSNSVIGIVIVLAALSIANKHLTVNRFGDSAPPAARLVAPTMQEQIDSGEAVILGRKCDIDAADAWRLRFWLSAAEYEFACDPKVPDRAKQTLFARAENRKLGFADIDPFEESIRRGQQRSFRITGDD